MLDKLKNIGSTTKILKISAIIILLVSSAFLPAYAIIRFKGKQQPQIISQKPVENVAVENAVVENVQSTINDQSELGNLVNTNLQEPINTINVVPPAETPISTPLPTIQPTPTPTIQATTQSLAVPPSKTISGGTHSYQTFNNCGPAALSMALSYFKITQSQQTLGNSLRPYQHSKGDNDDKSVTLQEIAKKAEEYGFIVYVRPAGTPQIIEAFIAYDIPVLTRTLLYANDDIGHFRLVKGYNQQNQTFIQDDSLQGKNLSYSYQSFQQLWGVFNNEFLVLVPKEKQAITQQILGELLDEKQAWQKALVLAQTKTTNDPTDSNAWFNQVVALYHLGRYQESVQIYEQIANSLPFRTLWYQIEPVLNYYKLENYDKVLDISNSILNNNNRAYSELHYLKAMVYQHKNQTDLAQTSFDAARFYNQSEYWKINLE